MKKKIATTLLVSFLVLSMSACGKSEGQQQTKESSALSSHSQDSQDVSKEELSSSQEPVKEGPDTENSKTIEPSYEIIYQHAIFHTDEYGMITARVIAEVKNTGDVDLYLPTGSYDLKARDGSVIHSSQYFRPSPQVISPEETGYYYEYVYMDEGTPTDGISISSYITPEVSKLKYYRLEVTNTAIFDKEYGGIDVHGEVTNTNDVAHEYLNITIVFFDSEGQSIGQASDFLSGTLQPGETRGFDIDAYDLPTSITTADIARYEVYAFPDQYQY